MTQSNSESALEARLKTLEARLEHLEATAAGAESANIVSILIPIIDYIRRDNLPEDRKILLSLKKGEVRDLKGMEAEELIRPARRAGSAYEVLGILLKEIDQKVRTVFYDNWGDSIIGCFKAAQRSGLLEMERLHNPNRWKNFEELAGLVEAYFNSFAHSKKPQ
jgi:hypothetical protein